ncbi:ketoisovalerate reductase [Xylaria sp. FL1042]|nr:ketoisovalerate reductase [Xylaria sp. FL1042]
MRTVRLSTTLASTARFQSTGTRGIPTRLMHSSARLRSVEAPREIPTEWLRRIIEDDTSPPKLYAWRPENLPSRSETGSQSTQGLKTGTDSRRDDHDDDDDENRRIYILGVGNIGRLYAMCLSKLVDAPPITLVVHRKELLAHWVADPGIELTRHGRVHRNAGFDIEWWTDVAPPPPPQSCGAAARAPEVAAGGHIGNLIVATKASDAVPQVDRVRRYLGRTSTVAFAQNGMCKLWPPVGDAYVRARFRQGASPDWIACVTTHGVTSQGPFKSTHASPANALVGPVMAGGAGAGAGGGTGEQKMGYLMRLIAEAPDLDARAVSRKELWVAQLEKLVVNAVINPLTAVLRCKNGELFSARDDGISVVIDKLLSEASEILRALVLDSRSDEILLSGSISEGAASEDSTAKSLGNTREELLERFCFARLRTMVLDVGAKVGANTSSMLQDVRAGKQTEIDDFNGWLVETARLLDKGLHLSTHAKLITLVKDKAALTRFELCERLL